MSRGLGENGPDTRGNWRWKGNTIAGVSDGGAIEGLVECLAAGYGNGRRRMLERERQVLVRGREVVLVVLIMVKVVMVIMVVLVLVLILMIVMVMILMILVVTVILAMIQTVAVSWILFQVRGVYGVHTIELGVELGLQIRMLPVDGLS